jgi:hypothetical protein
MSNCTAIKQRIYYREHGATLRYRAAIRRAQTRYHLDKPTATQLVDLRNEYASLLGKVEATPRRATLIKEILALLGDQTYYFRMDKP